MNIFSSEECAVSSANIHKVSRQTHGAPIVGDIPDNDDANRKWVHHAAIVSGVQSGDPSALSELYEICSKGTHNFFKRRGLPAQDMPDSTHNVFMSLLTSIRRNQIQDPRRLMGFVRTVLDRAALQRVRHTIDRRRREQDIRELRDHKDPAAGADLAHYRREQVELVKLALEQMCSRDREILRRFYFLHETPAQICEEMGLTETQYRLFKSNAKTRLAKLTRKVMQKRSLGALRSSLQPTVS